RRRRFQLFAATGNLKAHLAAFPHLYATGIRQCYENTSAETGQSHTNGYPWFSCAHYFQVVSGILSTDRGGRASAGDPSTGLDRNQGERAMGLPGAFMSDLKASNWFET